MLTEKCCRLKSTSGVEGKRLFVHILRTNRRIFEIQTAYGQVLSSFLGLKYFDIILYLTIYFRFGRENCFAHKLRTNGRIF